jgi:endonuclease YncB( thermonuclease family)
MTRPTSIVLVALSLVAVRVVGAEYPETISGSLERIVDGDGLYLVGYDHQVRLWGIDAPERGDKGYLEAGAHLGSLTDGYEVQCNKKDVDQYRRLVGQCFLPCQRRRKTLPLGRSKSRPRDVAPWGVMPSSSKHVPRRVGRQANMMD